MQERRTTSRREIDKELHDMSQKALDKAIEVENKIEKHLAVCELQNEHIIEKLTNQGRIMYGVAAAIGLMLLGEVWGKLFH